MVSTIPTKLRKFHGVTSYVKNYIATQQLDKTLKNHFHERLAHHITSVKGKLEQGKLSSLFKVFALLLISSSVRCIFSTSTTHSASESMGNNIDLSYDDLLKAQKDDNVLIIDVRENGEIQETGKLPGSIHIPMGEVPSALILSSQEFENKYQKKKPSQDEKIVLSCRSGKRSAMVQSELQKLGYKNALNYGGGWLEWESHQKA